MFRKRIKWILFKMIYPFCYNLGKLRSVKKDKIVIVENHHSTLSDDFLLLYQSCKEQGYQIKVHYLKVATSSWGTIVKRSIALLFDIADARCIMLSESNSLFGAFSLRKHSSMIQLWHGCGAFKKWGFSLKDKSFGDDEKNLELYNGHRNYSLVPVSGSQVCFAYQEAFGIQNKDVVKPLGVSRTDVFFHEEKTNLAREKVRQYFREKGISKNKKMMLYMPTFRGSIKGAFTPSTFDVEQFCKQFGDDYVLLIKQHPFVKKPYFISNSCNNQCFEIMDELTSFELMIASDCLITDYSSVVFEYSLLEKPMLFFSHDLDSYYDERGFYFDYHTFVPGSISKTMDELLKDIANLEQWDKNKVLQFKNSYMNGCDGRATERIMSYIRKHD